MPVPFFLSLSLQLQLAIVLQHRFENPRTPSYNEQSQRREDELVLTWVLVFWLHRIHVTFKRFDGRE